MNIKKKKVYSTFIDNVWSVDLADLQLKSKFNKEFRFLLCVDGNDSKYAWAIPLKDKKGITITYAFQKFQMNQIANQIKYGQAKVGNYIIEQ